MADFDRESMLEMFTFEMNQLLEQLEQTIIQGENGYTMDQINEIFRIMHTIKGSAAMMLFNSISTAAHAIEDLFFYLREENPTDVDFSRITDLVLEGMDFIKEELIKIETGDKTVSDNSATNQKIKDYLAEIKGGKGGTPQSTSVPAKINVEPVKKTEKKTNSINDMSRFKAIIRFEDGCEMENIRAFTLLNNLKPIASDISHIPDDIIDECSIEDIRKNGFEVIFSSEKSYDDIYNHLNQTVYLRSMALDILNNDGEFELVGGKIYYVIMRFEESAEMENVRAYNVLHSIKDKVEHIKCIPDDLLDETSINIIKADGFKMEITTTISYNELNSILAETIFLRELIIEGNEMNNIKLDAAEAQKSNMQQSTINNEQAYASVPESSTVTNNAIQNAPIISEQLANTKKAPTQNVISVNVSKLDKLLKLMGELVISEAMVTQNPELEGLQLDSFIKEARQLRITLKDLQDTIMSMRMVSLAPTFFKMNRIVRDMCKQLNKEIQLEIVGENNEVDKNTIEHISDPIMHIIRNSADHGIEMPEERIKKGKSEKGTILLEAKNSGSDVLIIIKDDGAGLNKERIMRKAINNGLLRKPENEYTDKEIHQFIFMPGFSTNESVTSFSGRGVGMDVVSKNLELASGTVSVDSVPGEGTTFTLKIPLTLAIIDGMVVKMGNAKYIIPIMSIKDTFRPVMKDVFTDPSGNEMITVRNEVYNVVRLYEELHIEPQTKNLEEGIMIMVENGDDFICLFIDDLIGEQQVVVKPLPKYIKKMRGISNCTLLGNGEISLIIDVAGFFDK